MSRKSRTLRTARLEGSLPVTKLRGPGDAATMVPYLLGFQPHDSLVVVDLEGPRRRLGPVLRIDLTNDPADVPLLASHVMRVLSSRRPARVLVVAYSEDAGLADPLALLILESLARQGIAVEDALRVGSGRWWSYVCTNPTCCGPEGTPFEPATSRVAAEAVVAGMSIAPDREALRALFSPAATERRNEVRVAVARLKGQDISVLTPRTVEQLPDRVAALLDVATELAADDVAWLALAVQSQSGRDAALSQIDRADADRHLDLWRTVMSLVDDEMLAPVGSLAAFAAWLDGRGVLASHALERVFAVAPDCSMAHYVSGLLFAAVDPRTWPGPLAARGALDPAGDIS